MVPWTLAVGEGRTSKTMESTTMKTGAHNAVPAMRAAVRAARPGSDTAASTYQWSTCNPTMAMAFGITAKLHARRPKEAST